MYQGANSQLATRYWARSAACIKTQNVRRLFLANKNPPVTGENCKNLLGKQIIYLDRFLVAGMRLRTECQDTICEQEKCKPHATTTRRPRNA